MIEYNNNKPWPTHVTALCVLQLALCDTPPYQLVLTCLYLQWTVYKCGFALNVVILPKSITKTRVA